MFSDTYDEARSAFRRLAAARGARLDAITIPGEGRDGEALSVDWAVIGDRSATRALLSISGVHGAEGYAGSAAQCAFLDALNPPDLPSDCSIVLIHALNPWGMSHRFRVNADNVDLSRNFIDFDAALPGERGYAQIHDAVCPGTWDVELPQRIEALFASTTARLGAAKALNAFTGGQYNHPDGLSFGGLGPSPSRLALEHVVGLELQACRRLAYLEWHTGFGVYGRPLSVALDAPGTPARQIMDQWWSDLDLQTADEAFTSGDTPDWTGLVMPAVRQMLPETEIIGSPIEIGTVSNLVAFIAVMIDRWFRLGEPSGSQAETDRLRAHLRNAYDPSDPVWRAQVIRAGLAIHTATLKGLTGEAEGFPLSR